MVEVVIVVVVVVEAAFHNMIDVVLSQSFSSSFLTIYHVQKMHIKFLNCKVVKHL